MGLLNKCFLPRRCYTDETVAVHGYLKSLDSCKTGQGYRYDYIRMEHVANDFSRGIALLKTKLYMSDP
jgi:hypothetical protein